MKAIDELLDAFYYSEHKTTFIMCCPVFPALLLLIAIALGSIRAAKRLFGTT